TTRIEPGLTGVESLAETIDPLRATQSPGISPAFDRQTRQPRSHYFAPESVRSCGANEKKDVAGADLQQVEARLFRRLLLSILCGQPFGMFESFFRSRCKNGQ